MANTTSKVRQAVNSKLDSATNTSAARPSQAANKTPSAPSNTSSSTTLKSNNLRYFSAAVAVYRSQNAPKDKPYTPTPEQLKDYEEARKQLAEKRGIYADADGSFREEHLANELSPLEVMKNSAFEHYNETQDNNKAYNDIQAEIDKSYSKDAQQPQEAPAPVTSMNMGLQTITFYTDADFLSLNEDDQKKYLESISEYGAEKERLENLIAENKNSGSDEEKTFALDKTNEDPDTPNTKDEDYKSKKGDIIEWMMDEVIMEGMDWIGNRCVDVITPVGYAVVFETCRGVRDAYREYKEEKEKERKEKAEQNNQNNPQPTPTNTPTPTNPPAPTNPPTPTNPPAPPPLTAEQTLSSIEIQRSSLKDPYVPSERELSFAEGVANGSIFLEKDFYLKNGSRYSYSSMGIDPKAPGKVDKFKLEMDAFNFFSINIINDAINTKKDPKIGEDIAKWVDGVNAANKEAALNGSKPKDVELPASLKKAGQTPETMSKHLEKARNEVVAFTRTRPIIRRMQHDSELFALNYVQYKMAEMMRGPQTDEITAKLQKPAALFLELKAEGKALMFKNYEALRRGDPKAITSEEMIQISEKMSKRSMELLNKKDGQTPSVDLIKERLDPQAKTPVKRSLHEFTFDDVINIELKNLSILNQEEKDLQNQQASNNSMRERIEEMKERHGLVKNKKERTDAVGKLKTHVDKTGVNNIQATKAEILAKNSSQTRR